MAPEQRLRPSPASAVRTGAPSNRATGLATVTCLAACLVSASCASFPENLSGMPPPVVDKIGASNAVVDDYLKMMQRLMGGTTSEKAEIYATAYNEYGAAPTASNTLRLALVLALPTHPATDQGRAQTLLRELMANPEALLPAEQILAMWQLQQLDDTLNLQSENKKLSGESARAEHLATQNHQLAHENEELRKQKEELQSRLDVIIKIEKSGSERSLSERSARKPNSSEGKPQ